MPILNWWRIQETGDLTYLLRNRSKQLKYRLGRLPEIWDKVCDDFIDFYGFTPDTFEVMLLQKDLFMRRCKLVQGDKTQLTLLQVVEKKLLMLKDKATNEKVDFFESKTRIESIIKHQINVQTTSVREYYAYVEMIKKDASKKRK